MKKHKHRIAPTFQLPYSSGPLETLNKIKTLKPIASSYRSFSSLRPRILLACRTTQKAA
ncbi:hypothetical protein ACWOFR_04290 [Carnobacterium gallinarum]|uniref:transposase n=1 Tax=Carnobacterium gallinarum TaxID=2749 RepID=UPI00147038ED